MITICLTYFRSLWLPNLEAALFCIRKQDLSQVSEVIIYDNNTDDDPAMIEKVVDDLKFPVHTVVISDKHKDATSRTHAYSTNRVVTASLSPWVFFTRADYLLEFDAIEKVSKAIAENRFIVGGYYDVGIGIDACNQTEWRTEGPSVLRPFGREYDHVLIDSGVWCTSRKCFNAVGGLDERLSAWGHCQTHFQHKMHLAGVEFIRLPEIIFYHTAHGYETPRDHSVAMQQLQEVGVGIQEMWARYNGPDNPYR